MTDVAETESLASYRVRLRRDDVWKLREKAARLSRETGRPTTWQILLRSLVAAAAAERGER